MDQPLEAVEAHGRFLFFGGVEVIARRELLVLGGVAFLDYIVQLRSVLAMTWPSPLVVILADIDLTVEDTLPVTIFRVFDSRRIPTVVGLNLRPGTSASISQQGKELLQRVAQCGPALCEFGLHATIKPNASSYEVLRAASDVQTEFSRCVGHIAANGVRVSLRPRTLITEGLGFSGGKSSPLLAAGVRTIIETGRGGPDAAEARTESQYVLARNGVAYFAGLVDAHSTLVDETYYPIQEIGAELSVRTQARSPIAMRLSVSGLSGIPHETAVSYAEQLATLIEASEQAGQLRYLTATTLFRQTYDGPLLYRVTGPAIVEKTGEAQADGYVCTKGPGAHDVIMKPSISGDANATESLDAVAASMAQPGAVRAPAGIGLDQFGRLHISLESTCGSLGDCVVADPVAGDAGDPGPQPARRDVAPLLSASEYYNAVLGTIPILEYVQQARAASSIRTPADPITPTQSARYRDDAATAWRYFERFRTRFGNLSPATIWIDNDGADYYPVLTMWDVGSLILATVSARRIGLIGDGQLENGARAVIAFLKTAVFVWGKSKLPAINWSIANKPGDLTGFDAADVGRLLIALKVLDQQSAGSLRLGALVATWDLLRALKGGYLHDHNGREWISTQRQLYSLYSRRGYQLWGLETARPFDDEQPAATMDRAVAFIDDASSRGPFATEPFVTDEVELGATEHSRLIADVMYAAQSRRFVTTGYLTAASEAPIDVSPWFTYQGLELRNDEETWTVHAPLGHNETQTEEFARTNRLQSSKASYLWAAARPADYHDKLVENIRSKAASPVGFASGVREFTATRTKVADINTNALILESIAYILGGRKSLCEPTTASN